jgi:hypothetical protein
MTVYGVSAYELGASSDDARPSSREARDMYSTTSPANGHESRLDPDSLHELWRMQLLDELRGKRGAIEWQPLLDPDGERAAALDELIARFEAVEADELQDRHPVELRPVDSSRPSVVAAWARAPSLFSQPLLFLRRLRSRKTSVRRARPARRPGG